MSLKPLKAIQNLEVDLRTQLYEVLSLQKKKQLWKNLLKVSALFSYRSQKAEMLKCHINTRRSPSFSFIQYKVLPKERSFTEQYKKRMSQNGMAAHFFFFSSPPRLLSGA